MKFLPTTHFKVLERTQDFPLDFQVTHATDYIVVIANSNNETYSISPLVIEQRLRQGRIKVIAFPAHPSHTIRLVEPEGQGRVRQCERCMLIEDEEQIQFECALPALEILGPDSFGGEDGRHSPAADTLRLHLAEEPLSDNTICPACVLRDPRLRLCVDHLNCPTCGNPRVLMCPACMTEVTR